MIWAGIGPIGNTEKKKFGPIMSNFWGQFFHVFGCNKRIQLFFENVAASTLKSCIISIWEKIFKKKIAPENMKKSSSNRAKFTINCVLLYWRHLPARLLYNDFDYKHNFSFSFQLCCMCQARSRKVLHRIFCKYNTIFCLQGFIRVSKTA